MEQWVTIYTFNYPHEAYVIKGRLESEGIFVFLKDENTVQAYNFLSNAIGGVKMQVRGGDVEKAMEILNETEIISNAEENIIRNDIEETDGRKQKKIMTCPNCGTDNVSETVRPNWIFALSFLLLGFPLFFIPSKYHCFDCGIEFRKKEGIIK